MNPVEVTLLVLEGRWKILIIQELLRGVRRFSELKRALNKITHKILTQKLRELEKDGVVYRVAYPEVSPRVDYALTPSGQAMLPVLGAMHDWGTQYLNEKSESNALVEKNGPAV